MRVHLIYASVIVFLVAVQFIERWDLYNRIMSRDYSEYKNDKPLSAVSSHRRIINKWRGKDGDNE